LYELIEQFSSTHEIETAVSYLEVYNETIRDLFKPGGKPLDLREDDTKVTVAGLSQIVLKNLPHLLKVVMKGNQNRTQAFTHANETSSRSHAVLQIQVKSKEKGSIMESIKFSTLSIIDLAGSERATATRNIGERLNEGANINRSLLALGNCINALCSEKPTHIPFR
jgi:hypothetical protein